MCGTLCGVSCATRYQWYFVYVLCVCVLTSTHMSHHMTPLHPFQTQLQLQGPYTLQTRGGTCTQSHILGSLSMCWSLFPASGLQQAWL